MITVNKANPTPGEVTSSLTGSTGDGAGLNLQSGGKIELTNGAAQFGTGDFSIEFILNQEKENTSDSYIFVTHTSGHNRLLISHDASDDNLVLDFRNASSASTKKDLAYDMNQDFGTPTHYVITFDRDGLATLYKNGNSVATVDISALSAIDIGTDSSGSRIGTGSTDGVIGTFYRFRTWNYLVDAKALFERADVPFAKQYGTTNAPFTSINLSSGWSTVTGGTSIVDSDSFSTTTSGAGVSYPLTIGKRYRVSWNLSGAAYDSLRQYSSGETLITISSATSGTVEFTAEKDTLYIRNGGAGTTDITSMSLVQIGAVVDMDLAAANPSQSRTIQDRAGSADGTCSTSGVSQVNSVVQVNAASARIGTTQATPADGQLLVSGGGGFGGWIAGATGANMLYGDGSKTYIQQPSATGKVVFRKSSGAEIVTIDGSGNVGVGCAPDAKLEVNGDSIWLGNASSDASGRILFNENTTSNGTQGFSLLYAGSANPTLDGTTFTAAANSFNIFRHTTAWGEAGTVAMSIARDTGLATFSNGINLGHETITKYDEGTFTPTLQFGGATTGITYGSIHGGVYTRIGRLVYVQIAFALTSKGTATGNATITGMPFTCGDLIPNTSIENALSYSHFSGLSDAVAFVSGTTVQLRNLAGTNLTNGAFTDSSSIRLAGCYAIASS